MAKKKAAKKKPSLTTINRRLDVLARDICKLSANFICQRCGEQGDSSSIEWAHIERRSKKAVRWEQYNCLALCNYKINNCHSWFDWTRVPSVEWLREHYPEKVQALMAVDENGVSSAEAKVSLTIDERLELETLLKAQLSELKLNVES